MNWKQKKRRDRSHAKSSPFRELLQILFYGNSATGNALLFSPGARALTPDQQDGMGEKPAAVAEELVFSNSMPTSWKNGALPRMSSRKKIADYFGITVEELMGTKKEPAGMGELDKQMQEIVALLNSATPEQRNAMETLLRSRAKPGESADKRQICFGRGFGQNGQNLGDQIRVLPQDSKDFFICHYAKTLLLLYL
ncbi:MAG: hypothetical protein ACLTML_20080 [Blautia faecis]